MKESPPGMSTSDLLREWRDIASEHQSLQEVEPLAIVVTGPAQSGKTALRHLIGEALTDVGGCASIDVAELRHRRRCFEPDAELTASELSDESLSNEAADWIARASQRRTPMVLEVEATKGDAMGALIRLVSSWRYRVQLVVVDVRTVSSSNNSPKELDAIGSMLDQVETDGHARDIRFLLSHDAITASRPRLRLFPGNRILRAKRIWNDWLSSSTLQASDTNSRDAITAGPRREAPACVDLNKLPATDMSGAAQKDMERRIQWRQLIRTAAGNS